MSDLSPSDVAAVIGRDGFGDSSSWVLIILFALIFGWGGNGFGGRNNDAATQEILYGQQFQGLDNKIDRIGNGIADATFALNSSIGAVGSQVQSCCCETQRAIDTVNYNLANHAAAIQANDTANTQKILDAISTNRIADMQNQINQLQLQNAMCGVVRYPTATTYNSGGNPFCYSGGGCCA